MKSIKRTFALVSMWAVLSLTACGNVENLNANPSSSVNDNTSYSGTESLTSNAPSPVEDVLPEKETTSSTDVSIAEFLVSEEGLDFQKVANKAAIAYLRNDKEKLSQYMVDPNCETGLSEDGTNLINNLDYMVLKIPSSFNVTSNSNDVYPATYEYVIEGTEMIMYLDLGLRLTDDGWKVEYIDLQG